MGLQYVVFAVLLHVAFSEPPPLVPPQCHGPPKGVEKAHECCKIPPFFTEEDFVECGFHKPTEDGPPGPPGPGHHHGPPDTLSANNSTNNALPSDRKGRGQKRKRRCTKQQCILKKYNLMKDDENVDHEAIIAFMDKWAEANPDFKPAIDLSKERCIGKTLPGPPHVCEPNKLVFCISSTLFMECPTWEERDGCSIMKQHIEECKKYIFPDS